MLKRVLRLPFLFKGRISIPMIIKFPFTQDPKYSDTVMNKLKQDAQQFYENTIIENDNSVEVKDANHFNSLIQESTQRVILIYCYAKWSKDCDQFDNELQNIIKKYPPLIKQVRIDVDMHPQIITQLQIRSIPFLGVVFHNQVVDSYTKGGDLEKVKSVIAKTVRIFQGEDTHKIIFDEFESLLQRQEYNQVLQYVQKSLQNKDLAAYFSRFQLYQLTALIQLKDIHAAQQVVAKLDKEELSIEEREMLDNLKLELQDLAKSQEETNELQDMLRELDKNPSNKELRYQICEYCVENKLYEIAIKQLLDLIRVDRNWEERKAQKKLIELFNTLGSSNSLVVEGRKQLGRILY